MSDADRRLKRFLAGADETEAPGRAPLDRYRIVRPIGSGASSTVYEAEDLDLGRRAALKIVPLDRAAATLLDRVEREARVLARLRHPNIVEIHDAGLVPQCPEKSSAEICPNRLDSECLYSAKNSTYKVLVHRTYTEYNSIHYEKGQTPGREAKSGIGPVRGLAGGARRAGSI